jgi:Flp pilus assembly protein TadD
VLNYLGYSWIDKGLYLDRAQGMIEKAAKLRPNDGYIIDSLGWVHYRLGRFEAASRELERAVELRPEDPIINDHLGDAYWRVGRKREAAFQWNRSLTLNPEKELISEINRKLKNGLGDDNETAKKPGDEG